MELRKLEKIGGGSLSVVAMMGLFYCFVLDGYWLERKKSSEVDDSGFSAYVEGEREAAISSLVKVDVGEVIEDMRGDVTVASDFKKGVHESYFKGQIDTDSYMFKKYRDLINSSSFEEVRNDTYTIEDVCDSIKDNNLEDLEVLKGNIEKGYLPEYRYLLKYNFNTTLEGDKCNLPDVEVQEVFKKLDSLFDGGIPKEYPMYLGEDLIAYNEELEVALANKDKMYDGSIGFGDNDFRTIRYKKEEDLNPVSEKDPNFRCGKFESIDDVYVCRHYYLYGLGLLRSRMEYSEDKVSLERSMKLFRQVIKLLSNVILNQDEDFEFVYSEYLKIHRDHFAKYRDK